MYVVPFIDAHNHMHSLPYEAWETVGMTGMAAAIISAGNPVIYQETPPETPDPAVVLRHWDGPIRLAAVVEDGYFYKWFVAVGLSMMTRVQKWEQLIELLPEYLRKPNVVAVGETGIDPIQYLGMEWPLEEQKAALAEEVRVAKEMDVPLILHTPIPKKATYNPLWDADVAEVLSKLPAERYKRHFLDLDMEIINRIGLNHRRLVIDHADETIIEYALHETDAWVGIRVGLQVPRYYTGPEFFADVVERYGPERLMINSDYGAECGVDLLAIPKAIREMRRRGIDELTIRRVVFDNANECFSLGLEA